MVGLARRRARRALRAHGKASRAAACALWAALALSVAAGSTAALYASGSQWVATRSSNALDELYHATIDECCYEVLAASINSDAALRSALSPVKSPSPYLTEGTKRHRSQWLSTFLYWSGIPQSYSGRGPRMRDVASVCFITGDCESVNACAEDGLTTQGKDLRLTVHYPLRLLGAGFKEDDTIDVEFLYLTGPKIFYVRSDAVWEIETYKGRRSDDVSSFLKKRGITKDAAVKKAMSIVKEELLPAFLARGGTVSRFSADFEEDGVTVNLDKDASDL